MVKWLAPCRVSSRAELALRQRLSQREDRIAELKDILASLQHGPHHHATSDPCRHSPLSSPRAPDHSTHRHSPVLQTRADRHDTEQLPHHSMHTTSPRQHHSGVQLQGASPRDKPDSASQQTHTHAAGAQMQYVTKAAVHTVRLPYFQQKSHKDAADTQGHGVTDKQAASNRVAMTGHSPTTASHMNSGEVLAHILSMSTQAEQAAHASFRKQCPAR